TTMRRSAFRSKLHDLLDRLALVVDGDDRPPPILIPLVTTPRVLSHSRLLATASSDRRRHRATVWAMPRIVRPVARHPRPLVRLCVIALLAPRLSVGSTAPSLRARTRVQCSCRESRGEPRARFQSRPTWRIGCRRLRMDLTPEVVFDERRDAVVAEKKLARSL